MDPMGLGGSLACQAPAFSQAMVAELKLISLQSHKFALLEVPMSKKFERCVCVMLLKYGSSWSSIVSSSIMEEKTTQDFQDNENQYMYLFHFDFTPSLSSNYVTEVHQGWSAAPPSGTAISRRKSIAHLFHTVAPDFFQTSGKTQKQKHDINWDNWNEEFVVSWLAGWLVGWLAGWLVGWLAGWLVGWLAGWLAGWLVGWLVGWFV